MKKVAFVNVFGTIPGESGYSRSHYICQYLVEAGYQVDYILGTFNHWKKAFKDEELYQKANTPYNIVRLKNTSYSRNISFERLISQMTFAKNLSAYFKSKEGYYDIVIEEMPPAEVGIECMKYCKRNGIPFVIDLNDLWPEAFSMVIKNKILWYILTTPIRISTNKVYANVDGVIGTSETYTKRPLKVNAKNPKLSTVFVGTDIENFDNGIKNIRMKLLSPNQNFG